MRFATVAFLALGCAAAGEQEFALTTALGEPLGLAERSLNEAFSQGETISTALTLAIGHEAARISGNKYVEGRLARQVSRAAAPAETPRAVRAALEYARSLTASIHGVNSAQFREFREHFNDAQIVEITMAVAYFNYLARLAQGLGLEHAKQDWIPLNASAEDPTAARVGLASDAELEWAKQLAQGSGIANSQRAMLRAPRHARAWREHWAAYRKTQATSAEMRLHASFAVSMANGCRYCTLHQVQGLRRLGVDVAKLQSMRKDDSALTAAERAAVVFARKLTKQPSQVVAADRTALQEALGREAANEIVMQTAIFNFMNRFTDGLRLPSEDEAIRIYQETFGQPFPERTTD
jgi:AhpD family alkylhydroperoxidase